MSGSFRPRSPNIIWPSLSSILIHYGRQWPELLTRPKTSNMHTYKGSRVRVYVVMRWTVMSNVEVFGVFIMVLPFYHPTNTRRVSIPLTSNHFIFSFIYFISSFTSITVKENMRGNGKETSRSPECSNRWQYRCVCNKEWFRQERGSSLPAAKGSRVQVTWLKASRIIHQ